MQAEAMQAEAMQAEARSPEVDVKVDNDNDVHIGAVDTGAEDTIASIGNFVESALRSTVVDLSKGLTAKDLVVQAGAFGDESGAQLFDMVDADRSGFISKREFTGMFKALKTHVLEEQATQAYQRKKIHKGKRRLKLACLTVSALAFFLVLMNGIMGAMVWVLLEENKEAHVDEKRHAMLASNQGQVIQTATASVNLPLSAAPAMTIERLGTIERLTVGLYLGRKAPNVDKYISAPPFLPSGTRGFMKKMYEVVGASKLSSTAVIFSLAEPGQSVIIQDGHANLTVRDTNGAVLWNEPICPDTAGCSAITVDSEVEANALLGKAEKARAASRLRRLGHGDGGGEECFDPSNADPEALDCECMQLLQTRCGDDFDDDAIEECYKTLMCSEWEFICDDWKTEHCPSRRLGEFPKLEDAFEGIDTFVKERTHGRRLGKCSQ